MPVGREGEEEGVHFSGDYAKAVVYIHIPMGAMERVVVLYSSWEKTGANSLMSVR